MDPEQFDILLPPAADLVRRISFDNHPAHISHPDQFLENRLEKMLAQVQLAVRFDQVFESEPPPQDGIARLPAQIPPETEPSVPERIFRPTEGRGVNA